MVGKWELLLNLLIWLCWVFIFYFKVCSFYLKQTNNARGEAAEKGFWCVYGSINEHSQNDGLEIK